MAKEEIYVSTDIEADGPCPGLYSMLSFGSVAFRPDGREAGDYSVNLHLLPDAEQHPDTMRWWKTQPEAWLACRKNLVRPEQAMPAYAQWLRDLPGKPVFVGYPAGFDFTFIYWYLHRFTGECLMGFSALDIKSYAMAHLGTNFRGTTKKNMPRRWFPKSPHTHVAVEDAREQGLLFLNIKKEVEKRSG